MRRQAEISNLRCQPPWKLYFWVHTGKQAHVEFMACSTGQPPRCSQFRADLGTTDRGESVFLELLPVWKILFESNTDILEQWSSQVTLQSGSVESAVFPVFLSFGLLGVIKKPQQRI